MSSDQSAHPAPVSPPGGGNKVLFSRSGADPVLIDHDARSELDDLDRTWGDDASNPRGNFVSAKRRRVSRHWFVYVSARGESLAASRFFPIDGTAVRVSHLPVRKRGHGTRGTPSVRHCVHPPSPSLVQPEGGDFSLIDPLDISASPSPDAESPPTGSLTGPGPMRSPVQRIPGSWPSIPQSASADSMPRDVGPQSPASSPIGQNMPTASPPTAMLGTFAVGLPWQQRLSDAVNILSVFWRCLADYRLALTIPTCVMALALSACLGAVWALRGQGQSYHFYFLL